MPNPRAKYPRIPEIRVYDLRNERFERLVAIAPCCKLGVKRTTTYWFCLCDCGCYHIAGADDLIKKKTQSCGCLHNEIIAKFKFTPTHSGTGTRLHTIWKSMKQRCYNPNNDAYQWYGARGIGISGEWVNNFENFRSWALSNGYEANLTVGRKCLDQSYTPENCQWISRAENGGRARRGLRRNGSHFRHFAVNPKLAEQLMLLPQDAQPSSKQARRQRRQKPANSVMCSQLNLF